MEHAGHLVEKDAFVHRLWPDTVVEDAALAENISRLRRALGDNDGQRLIVTVPKRGYRFEAPVRIVDPGARPATPSSRSWVPAIAGVLTIALGLGFYLTHHGRPADPHAEPHIHSLAVLPFENVSHDPEQEYFADGMTDELITHLARIRALRVISRTSVMRFKGTRLPLPEVARQLDVDAVVEGTVLRSAQRMRVTAQVIQASPEAGLWAESYDRPLGDAVQLQGELAREIAQRVSVRLTPQEETRLAETRPIDPAAHEAFLKGRYYWSKRTEEGTHKAIAYFQQAIDRDPGYAIAYSGLADSHISLALAEALQESASPREAFPLARAAVDRALALDDGLGAAHASLAHIKFQYDRDWTGSEKEFQRAIELDPGYANAHHWYALSLQWRGRTDEALREMARARDLDPLSLVINANLGLLLACAHRYEEAVEQGRRTLELDPSFAHGHYRLGQVELLAGRSAEAVPELEKAIALSGGSPRATGELGLAHGLLGHRAQAERLLADLERRSHERYVSPFDSAVIYGGLGDREHALAWLEKAEADRSPSLSQVRVSPAFAGLRSDDRFVALVRRLGLAP